MNSYTDPHEKYDKVAFWFQIFGLCVVLIYCVHAVFTTYKRSILMNERMYIPRHVAANPQVIMGSSTIDTYITIVGGSTNEVDTDDAFVCVNGKRLGRCVSRPTESGICDCK